MNGDTKPRPMNLDGTSNVRWLLVFCLFILSVVAFLDRVNISIAGAPLSDDYHFTNVRLGNIFSALLFGYAVFQTLGGRIADRFGTRTVLAAGVVWWGIFTAATAFVPANAGHAFLMFIVIRFLLGAGEAVIYPASNQFVSRWIPAAERGIANGWIFAGVGVGAGLSPPLITALMLRYGWRSSFIACALLGLVAGFAWYVIARDRPEDHPRVSKRELQHIKEGLTIAREQTGRVGRPRLVGWSTLFFSKEVVALTFSYFCFGYVAWIFFSWFFIYLARVRGLNLKASALYAMIPPLAMAICSVLGGLIGDRVTRWKGPRMGRCMLASVALLLAAAFLVVGSRVESVGLASLVLAGGAGSLYLAQSSFWSVTANIGGASSGSVSGFMNTGGQIGGMLTATLTPWIGEQFGWTPAFVFAAVLATLGALAWFMVDAEHVLHDPDSQAFPESREMPHQDSAKTLESPQAR